MQPPDSNGCELYVGPGVRTASGHIRISVGGSKVYAHRYAYFTTRGAWPEVACHVCDEPRCVATGRNGGKSHVYSGTAQTNVADREARNRRSPNLPRRPAHWSSRLSQRDLDELVEARMMGIPAVLLAEEYGVSPSTVRSVWRREGAAA